MKENFPPHIYNEIDVVILIINDDYTLESINQKGKDLFHIEEEDLPKKKCYDFICKKQKPENNCLLLCAKNKPVTEKSLFIEKNGHIYKGTCKQLKHNNSKLTQYLFVFQDITGFVENEKEIKKEYEALNEEYLSSIEEQKRKNAIILDEKQKYEQLFTNMNSAFALHEIILDNKGEPCDYRFLECNPMFEEQTGLKATQIMGKTVLEVLPGTEKYWIETYGKVALGGEPIQFENYAKELGKYYKTFSYSPRRGFFAVTFNDITVQKKEEQELRRVTTQVLESEAKFKAAFMTSPDAININALDGTYVEINEGFTALTGFAREDVIGIKSSDINIWAIPEDREKLINALNKAGKIENIESVFRCKDGSFLTAIMSATLIKINNEPHILSVTRDITDIKLGDKKLKVENAIAEAFAITDNNIVFHDVLVTLLDFFQCEYGLFGYIDEYSNLVCPYLTHKIWDKCQMPEKTLIFPKEQWGGIWGESLIKKKSIIKNKNLIVPEGHIKLKNALSVAIADKSELVGIIVLGNKPIDFTDVERKHLEEFCQYILPLLKACLKELNYKEEILLAKEKAEKADRLKSVFLANMSHEIRTPLNGIMGFTDLLTSQSDLPEEQKIRYASIITKSSESLIQIVNDILDISSLESGNFNLFYKPFNLNNCILELYNLFAKKISENNKPVELSYKMPNEKNILNNDENRFRQVFSNLIDNAIKFTQIGNIQLGISEITDNTIVFFVSDTGIGIPEDKYEVIFDRFRQGEETSTRVYGGNGLGLSIVKELVKLMGGEIWLHSVFGKGTTFYFTLPKSESTDVVETKTNIEFKTESANVNVLIVEDDIFNAEYLEEIMRTIKAKYTVCKDGQSAIDYAKSGDFDIILLDIQLPDISGLEVAKEIRKFNRKITIIAQTANAMHSDEIKAISAGCSAYVSKPIDKKILLEKIDASLNIG